MIDCLIAINDTEDHSSIQNDRFLCEAKRRNRISILKAKRHNGISIRNNQILIREIGTEGDTPTEDRRGRAMRKSDAEDQYEQAIRTSDLDEP
jgi:hypothetical protein